MLCMDGQTPGLSANRASCICSPASAVLQDAASMKPMPTCQSHYAIVGFETCTAAQTELAGAAKWHQRRLSTATRFFTARGCKFVASHELLNEASGKGGLHHVPIAVSKVAIL